MKRLLLPMLALLLLFPGCDYIRNLPESLNQPPIAYMDSISPTKASFGEMVTFEGHGTDPNGTVVAYRWRSSLDGDLSTRASFQTSSLSPGVHTIYFKVQDNNGAWSAETAWSNVTIFAGAAALPVINFFYANPGSIAWGGSSTLSWNVSRATTVHIDKGIGYVGASGICFFYTWSTSFYTLTASNEAGNITASAQVVVGRMVGLPVIHYFNATPPVIAAGDWTTLSWSVSNATQITIMPGIGSVAAAGSINISPAMTTSYTLTAINSFGRYQMIITVAVISTEYTLTLRPLSGESGYVRSDGQVIPRIMYVGDDESNRPLQAFLSFDVSGIPARATISGVVVDFSNYDSIYGDPFSSLGCLRAYLHDYGVLDGGDYFTGTPAESLISFCSVGDMAAQSSTSIRNTLQARVGSSRFQMRLQFTEIMTDGDGNSDLVSWTSSHLPQLIVTYTTP